MDSWGSLWHPLENSLFPEVVAQKSLEIKNPVDVLEEFPVEFVKVV